MVSPREGSVRARQGPVSIGETLNPIIPGMVGLLVCQGEHVRFSLALHQVGMNGADKGMMLS